VKAHSVDGVGLVDEFGEQIKQLPTEVRLGMRWVIHLTFESTEGRGLQWKVFLSLEMGVTHIFFNLRREFN